MKDTRHTRYVRLIKYIIERCTADEQNLHDEIHFAAIEDGEDHVTFGGAAVDTVAFVRTLESQE